MMRWGGGTPDPLMRSVLILGGIAVGLVGVVVFLAGMLVSK